MAKIVIIINGDTEQRHLDNVERRLKIAGGEKGSETYVLSPKTPRSVHDHYFAATPEGINKLRKQLEQIKGVPEVIDIYTTGHGSPKGVCLQDNCDTKDIFILLDKLPYAKKREVQMDQCFGGNWRNMFLDDPKTLFYSPGSETETVCCQETSQYYWSDSVPDLNKDGIISKQERYAHAVTGKKLSSIPRFVSSPGYVQDGKAPFSTSVTEFNTTDDEKNNLKKLKQGQYAIMLFSAPPSRCNPCGPRKAKFKQMAKDSGGQHLWLMTENLDLAAKHGIDELPAVVIIDANGETMLANDPDKVLEELTQFPLPIKDRWIRRIAIAKNKGWDWDRSDALKNIAGNLPESDLDSKVLLFLFDKLISASEDFMYPEYQAKTLSHVAVCLSQAGFKDKAVAVFTKSISVSQNILSDWSKADFLKDIACNITQSDLDSKVLLVLFDKLFSAALNIENLKHRVKAIRDIASFLTCGVAFKCISENCKNRLSLLYGKLFFAAKNTKDAKLLKDVAGFAKKAGVEYKLQPTFDKMISDAENIKKVNDKAIALNNIAVALASAGFKEKALTVFEKAIFVAENIKSASFQNYVLRNIVSSLKKSGFKERAEKLRQEFKK